MRPISSDRKVIPFPRPADESARVRQEEQRRRNLLTIVNRKDDDNG